MPRQKKKSDAPEGAPAWIVTFSDLMSLLLTFFVLLLSFSTVSEKDFNDAMMSVKGALGVFERHMGVISHQPRPPRLQSNEEQNAARRVRRRMQIQGMEKSVKVTFEAVGGLKINLPGEVLFEAGAAELRSQALPVLQDIAEVLREFPDSFIEVRGHTDASPVSADAPFTDNYDLSYARARAVYSRLSGAGGLPEGNFEITAAGASQPQALNDTPEGRSANRRVEIFVRGLVDKDKIGAIEQGGDETPLPALPPGEEETGPELREIAPEMQPL